MRRLALFALVGVTLGAACDRSRCDRRSDEERASSEANPPAEEREESPAGSGDDSDASGPSADVSDEWSFRHPPCEERPAEEFAAEPEASERTEEYEVFVADVRELAEEQDAEFGRSRWRVEEQYAETCREWVAGASNDSSDADDEAGGCTVEFQPEQRVAVIHRRAECGGDSCTVYRWVWPETHPQPTRIDEVDSFTSIEVLPSLDTLVLDRGFAGISNDSPVSTAQNELKGGMPRILLRSPLERADACVLATCFAPKLAPDGKTVTCRTKGYHVRALPAHGAFGSSREVASADGVPGEPHIRVQWGEFASPVEFVGEGAFEYEVTTDVTRDGGSRETETATRSGTLAE